MFPFNGLGTGRAKLMNNAPRIFMYLTQRLLDEFNFNNMMNLTSYPF